VSHATAEIIDRPPGHARILGAPRSGKTTLLVERFHHLVRAGHHPLVIAFGREQRDLLLERLIPPGTARFGAMPVTTHGMLATRLISAARPRRTRTLRDVDERVVLDRVMRKQTDLLRSDLRSIAGSSALHDDLLRVLHVLAQNGLAADEAEKAVKRAGDERAADVLRLFAAYRRQLRERGLNTFYDAAWEAARLVAEDASLVAGAGVRDVLLVDDVQDLDAGQFALLRALAPPTGAVALESFGDTTGPRFSFRGTSDRFFMEEIPAAYRPVDFRLRPPQPANRTLAAVLESLHTPERAAAAAPIASTDVAALPLFAAAAVVAETEREIAVETDWNVHVRAVRAARGASSIP
jgi:superfamily I DNA/RNA helicase